MNQFSFLARKKGFAARIIWKTRKELELSRRFSVVKLLKTFQFVEVYDIYEKDTDK